LPDYKRRAKAMARRSLTRVEGPAAFSNTPARQSESQHLTEWAPAWTDNRAGEFPISDDTIGRESCLHAVFAYSGMSMLRVSSACREMMLLWTEGGVNVSMRLVSASGKATDVYLGKDGWFAFKRAA
jgi:hypothetical protein